MIEAMKRFDIESAKVHLVLRDAAASMKKTTELMNVNSFDCFTHKLQLSIKDGMQTMGDLDDLFEKCKRLVRKVRKSNVQREYFKELQKQFDSPLRILSQHASNDLNNLPVLTEVDWALIESLLNVLAPIYAATMELQARKTTISCVIPMYRSLVHSLKKAKGVAMLDAFRAKIAQVWKIEW
uniref:Uncharacterized protein n=1 Tax=Ditylenchus dipsaci TaxID=166011 RepID=A0A915DQY9_9BILA